MLPRRDEPFPLEATRDLLGIVRALYRATHPTEVIRRRHLARVGAELQEATALAAESALGTMGHRAAWARAEAATRALGELVDGLTMAAPLVRAAQGAALRRLRRAR